MDVHTPGERSGASNLLGMPETSFRGLSTRTARSVRRSTCVLKCVPAVARMLWAHRDTAESSQGKLLATSGPCSHTRLVEARRKNRSLGRYRDSTPPRALFDAHTQVHGLL